VDITTVPSTSPDKTIIKVKVKEQSTGELTFGAGYSTSLGPLGNIGLRERNLLGKGQDASANITISGKRSSGEVSFTDPYFLDKNVSAGVDLFFRRLDPGPNLQEQAGGGLRMGYDLTEYLRQTLSYQFRGDRIYHFDNDAPSIIRQEEGWKYYSIVGQTLTYDRRDSQFDPRDGYFATLETHFSGVGGNVKYISGTLKGGYFYPVTKSVTVSLTNEVGYIEPLFGDYLHYPDGFFLGGGDSLRGFDTHGVGPRQASAKKKVGSIGGQFLWDGTLQASFPLGLPEEYQIRGRVFSDFGVLTGYDAKDKNVKINDTGSIRASAGFGITWVSPFGPLAVDLAYPVVRESDDKTQYFSFSFGTNF
jgi:outer membrane protein insertion porin family